jgi:monoamine oxidase
MVRIAIVGGGPSGLFTARLIEEKYRDFCQITIFEASGRTGGKIVTGRFNTADVRYEAGVAELYGYEDSGPDPLLQLVRTLGLRTAPMAGTTIVLNDRILRNERDIKRLCGRKTAEAIRSFREECRAAMPVHAWRENDSEFDNAHPWARRPCGEILDAIPDPVARRYLRTAVHSDLATEPHLTNGLNGLKNFVMDLPGYIRLYSVDGGIERLPARVREDLRHTRIEVNRRVTRIAGLPDGTYRVCRRDGKDDFDAVFVALPHNWLGSIEWEGEPLRGAMSRFIGFYDRPGHYLRVTALFRRPFWRDSIKGSWFMLDAFGGCCVYDEGTRHDTGEFGVLSWLIAGTTALSMNGLDDVELARVAMETLPQPLDERAARLFVEAKVHRWPAAVSGQPGGFPVRDAAGTHLPDPAGHSGLFMVGDYLFDSTINGALDSADTATGLFDAWLRRQRLVAAA